MARPSSNSIAARIIGCFGILWLCLLAFSLRLQLVPLIVASGMGLSVCVVVGGILFHTARWNRRFRRGCCPKCGYDMRANPDCCSECGWESIHSDSDLQSFLTASAREFARTRDASSAKR